MNFYENGELKQEREKAFSLEFPLQHLICVKKMSEALNCNLSLVFSMDLDEVGYVEPSIFL
jgi:hypothetical protein